MIFFRKERPRQSVCVWVTADAAAIICSHHRRRFCGSSPRVIIFLEPPRCLTQRWWGIHLNYKIIQPFTAAGERDRPLRRFSLSLCSGWRMCWKQRCEERALCVRFSGSQAWPARKDGKEQLAGKKQAPLSGGFLNYFLSDRPWEKWIFPARRTGLRSRKVNSLARSRLLLHF